MSAMTVALRFSDTAALLVAQMTLRAIDARSYYFADNWLKRNALPPRGFV
jgi:hypothetical protein